MHRRSLLIGTTVSFATISGCQSDFRENTNKKPEFGINEDAPGTFILLRNQPQNPNGIVVGDEFKIGLHLGNAGGAPASGEISVKFSPPNEEVDDQTANFVVEDDNAIPSGEARFFTFGSFEATVAGDWELTAASGIEQIHQSYDNTIKVKEQSGA